MHGVFSIHKLVMLNKLVAVCSHNVPNCHAPVRPYIHEVDVHGVCICKAKQGKKKGKCTALLIMNIPETALPN